MLHWIWTWFARNNRTPPARLKGGGGGGGVKETIKPNMTLDTLPLDTLDCMAPREVEALVVDVYDADTITIVFSFQSAGFFKERIRLAGIDAWEMKPSLKTVAGELRSEADRANEREKAILAATWLRDQILRRHVWVVVTGDPKTRKKRDNFGRLLAEVYPLEARSSQAAVSSYNQRLVAEGHAYPYDGKKKRDFGAEQHHE